MPVAFQKLPEKLIKEPGSGPMWWAFNSFCHTDNKNFVCILSFEEISFWQLHP